MDKNVFSLATGVGLDLFGFPVGGRGGAVCVSQSVRVEGRRAPVNFQKKFRIFNRTKNIYIYFYRRPASFYLPKKEIAIFG